MLAPTKLITWTIGPAPADCQVDRQTACEAQGKYATPELSTGEAVHLGRMV